MTITTAQAFPFRFSARHLIAGLPWGITPATTAVHLGEDELRVRFGPWSVRTPRANIVGAEVSGPYSFVKNAGPARLSFADRGLTMATNGDAGVCLRFRDPIRGIEPTGRLRHPGLTLTVADPDRLAALILA